MKKLFIIFTIVFLAGCSKWQLASDRIYLATPEQYDCRYRVWKLSKKLWRANEDFAEVYGWHEGVPHKWIEKDGKILDPSIEIVDKRDYKEDYRIKYRGGEEDIDFERIER